MKLLCQCGHPNLLHFAGTGHCHVSEPGRFGTVPGVYDVQLPHCPCEAFVLDESALELVRERKDTA